MLEKSERRTYEDIGHEYGVNIRSVQSSSFGRFFMSIFYASIELRCLPCSII
jgi:hypothetical protein